MFIDAKDVHPYGSFWLDAADKAIKAIAVGVAGWWTWSNNRKSRTYMRKLEPSVTGEFFENRGLFFVLVNCHLKNVGQSVYEITPEGTGLEAVTLSPNGRVILSISTVFTQHAWIEPGEQIDDPLVLPIPDPKTFVALHLNLRIVSKGVEWNGSAIVKAQDKKIPTEPIKGG